MPKRGDSIDAETAAKIGALYQRIEPTARVIIWSESMGSTALTSPMQYTIGDPPITRCLINLMCGRDHVVQLIAAPLMFGMGNGMIVHSASFDYDGNYMQ